MKYKRIGRSLFCLLLVCVLLLNVSPIRAEATASGLLGSIAGVTSVNVPAGLVYGAAAIALGVAAGANEDFSNLVNAAVSTGTEWIKDGAVELLRVVDATGKAVYYAAGEMLESLRSWLFDEGVVSLSDGFATSITCSYPGFTGIFEAEHPFAVGYYTWYGKPTFIVYSSYLQSVYTTSDVGSETSFSLRSGPYGGYYVSSASNGSWTTSEFSGVPYLGEITPACTGSATLTQLRYVLENLVGGVTTPATDFDLILGQISTVPIDGSSALDWAPEYQANRLYVTGGSNDPDPPDENNGKWFWPLALTLTAADLYLMSQADEWSGETPQEFDDYTQNTEYEIISRPEFDGYTGIEISPKPEQNPDTGENPGIGGDTGMDEDAETTWFQRIVKGIEELPSKFGSWLDKILEWLEKIWEGIISIPQTILDGLKSLLIYLFAPSESFIATKVETLISKYPSAATFTDLGNSLKAFFNGLGVAPPIIYIDLGAAESSYFLGGREIFVDLTWYSRYKPTVDSIIGSFIWLWLAWRVFLSLPGIIHGEAGAWGERRTDIGLYNTSGATIVHQRELPTGKK